MATAVAPSSVGDPFLDHVAVVDDDSDDDSDALADELEADLVEAEARRGRGAEASSRKSICLKTPAGMKLSNPGSYLRPQTKETPARFPN